MRIPALLPGGAAALSLALALPAQAVVEADTIKSLFQALQLTFIVDQTADGDATGVVLNYTQGVLKFVTQNVDEGADLFLVQPGDVFTNAFADASAALFLGGVSGQGSSGVPAQQLRVGQDFYIGARTRSFSDPGFSWSPLSFGSFGWAHVVVDAQGVPRVVGSAMAFREGGIVVGTLQAVAVPEPGTLPLAALGLLGLAWAVSRRA